MSSLIAICVHSTEANDRLRYTKECLESLKETVDFEKHRVIIINNASSPSTKKYLSTLKNIFTVMHLSENIGTAKGINLAIVQRRPGEVVIKMDDDVVVHQKAWVEELELAISEKPNLGILGLKRDDVWQNPTHKDSRYRTFMDGKLELCDDIIGTCIAYNPLLLDKVGFLNQPSCYGFDDVLISVRSIAAGFVNAFLPHIKITHLDDGKNPYCDWKKREAGIYIGEVSNMCDMYSEGTLNYFYDGGF